MVMGGGEVGQVGQVDQVEGIRTGQGWAVVEHDI
jgi:hypothetical protein